MLIYYYDFHLAGVVEGVVAGVVAGVVDGVSFRVCMTPNAFCDIPGLGTPVAEDVT